MKKALICVPHQDDEINIVGNVLDTLSHLYEIFVLYSSLDTNPLKGKIRKKEAVEACAVFGIKESHIIFLEYPDTSNKNKEHYYIVDKSIEENIEVEIVKLMPELIIGTDFDFHSDHRMLSIALENSIKTAMCQIANYSPIVLKGFCYETAYYGLEDYKATNILKCEVKNKLLSNASFQWDERISIPSSDKNRLIWNRKAYKGLSKHDSQYAVLHALSIINSDNVFWQRRTDNLLYKAKLKALYGNIEKIRDFHIIDCDDIITINPREIDYSKSMWRPCEDSSYIEIFWDEYIEFDKVIIYGNPNAKFSQQATIELIVEDKVIAKTSFLKPYAQKTTLDVGWVRCKSMRIEIQNYSENFGISEMEILSGEQRLELHDSCIEYKKSGIICDVFNYVGYSLIKVFTRIKRKIRNVFASKY